MGIDITWVCRPSPSPIALFTLLVSVPPFFAGDFTLCSTTSDGAPPSSTFLGGIPIITLKLVLRGRKKNWEADPHVIVVAPFPETVVSFYFPIMGPLDFFKSTSVCASKGMSSARATKNVFLEVAVPLFSPLGVADHRHSPMEDRHSPMEDDLNGRNADGRRRRDSTFDSEVP